MLGYIDKGVAEGARLVLGGKRPAHLPKGYFVEPTLFADVENSMTIAQEEIFGPVLAAMPFDTYDKALEIANGVSLGLTASVYTRDLGIAHRFARDIEVGYVWVNDSQKHFPGAPYGGWKNSGVGREEGIEELLSYTQVKNVNVRF